jgi:hypothetical protein
MQGTLRCGARSAQLRGLAFRAAARRSGTRTASTKSSVIRELHRQLVSKERSAEEVARSFLDAVGRTDGVVASYVTVDSENALAQVGPPTSMYKGST